ncbi:MAG TPA: DUF4112 domain-containing protein [Caulobacteraceae bacterium]|jgi:hypothetical protein
MRARSKADVEKIRGTVDQWRKVSDRLFSVGKFGVGLDGILTLIPAVGGIYGAGAGGFLLLQAHRAHASKGAMTKMAAMVGGDFLVGEIWIVGDVFDFFFRAHARAARTLTNEMDRTHYVEESEAAARAGGRLEGHRAEMRASGRKRLVFLHDRPATPPPVAAARIPAAR